MTLQATGIGQVLDRARWARVAEGLAIAVAVSLPWSTTATAILIVLWLLAVLPVLDPAAVRRVVMTPAGGLPVLLWLLAVVGMLWADVSWAERFAGLGGFHKLLVIPLLLAQFRNATAACGCSPASSSRARYSSSYRCSWRCGRECPCAARPSACRSRTTSCRAASSCCARLPFCRWCSAGFGSGTRGSPWAWWR